MRLLDERLEEQVAGEEVDEIAG